MAWDRKWLLPHPLKEKKKKIIERKKEREK